ncbi:Calcium-binding protein CML42 [Senna tora]|uniref:Calcium-binding protein CML42 n=1 Tax=Senna tora TaxID=362788 RepID=A0A834WJL5_9FABA|nr:Calcium-binding protein CML42 [Senna tora]
MYPSPSSSNTLKASDKFSSSSSSSSRRDSYIALKSSYLSPSFPSPMNEPTRDSNSAISASNPIAPRVVLISSAVITASPSLSNTWNMRRRNDEGIDDVIPRPIPHSVAPSIVLSSHKRAINKTASCCSSAFLPDLITLFFFRLLIPHL